MLAAADVLAGFVNGKRLGELHGIDDAEIQYEVRSALGEMYENRWHCVNASVDALKSAFADLKFRYALT